MPPGTLVGRGSSLDRAGLCALETTGPENNVSQRRKSNFAPAGNDGIGTRPLPAGHRQTTTPPSRLPSQRSNIFRFFSTFIKQSRFRTGCWSDSRRACAEMGPPAGRGTDLALIRLESDQVSYRRSRRENEPKKKPKIWLCRVGCRLAAAELGT